MPSITPLHTIERSLAAKLRLHTWPPLDVKNMSHGTSLSLVNERVRGPRHGVFSTVNAWSQHATVMFVFSGATTCKAKSAHELFRAQGGPSARSTSTWIHVARHS